MKTFLCLLLLSIAALPLAAQVERRMVPERFPPEIVSKDELPRDVVRVGAPHVRVDFENERTRVLRLIMGAGDTIPSHDARAGVLVCVAGCRLRFTLADGKSQDVELRAGETRWMPEDRRVLRNLGTRAVEFLYIETKRT